MNRLPLSRTAWLGLICLLFAPGRLTAGPLQSAALDHFEQRVRPLLLAQCVKCHGPEKTRAQLRLDSAAGLGRGGTSGPIVVAGQPDQSLLIEAIRQTGTLKMPPDGKLKEEQIADL